MICSFVADRGDAHRRLDHVVRRHLAGRPDASRTQVQAWIEAGRVAVTGRTVGKVAARVMAGDAVVVFLPPLRERSTPRAEDRALTVLYEDDHLLALDKPPGIVVHPSFGHAEGTLMNALLWHARAWPDATRPSLVQRLDKDTSGVLLVAKSRAVHARLQRAMQAQDVEKDYLAIVYGRPGRLRGTIDLVLARDPLDRRRVLATSHHGRAALTSYERLATARAPSERVSLLRCRLLTGRTHQIRVHLASSGWPIVGDPVYGAPRWKGVRNARVAMALREFPRQALHAWRVKVRHPATGEWLEAEAPLPDDMRALASTLGLSPPAGCGADPDDA